MNQRRIINLALGLTLMAPVALASDCSTREKEKIKKALSAKVVFQCVPDAAVIAAKQGGTQQAVVLYDAGEEGVAIAIFPTFAETSGRAIAPKPLYVFTSLGDHPLTFSSSQGPKTKLFLQDLDNDGYAEILALILVQPNSQLVAKSFDSAKGKFRSLAFKFENPSKAGDDEELTLGTAPDERLQVPDSLKEPFLVTGPREKRVYKFSKYLD